MKQDVPNIVSVQPTVLNSVLNSDLKYLKYSQNLFDFGFCWDQGWQSDCMSLDYIINNQHQYLSINTYVLFLSIWSNGYETVWYNAHSEIFLFFLAGLKLKGSIHSLMSFQFILFQLQRETEILNDENSHKTCKIRVKFTITRSVLPIRRDLGIDLPAAEVTSWKAVIIILNQQ